MKKSKFYKLCDFESLYLILWNWVIVKFQKPWLVSPQVWENAPLAKLHYFKILVSHYILLSFKLIFWYLLLILLSSSGHSLFRLYNYPIISDHTPCKLITYPQCFTDPTPCRLFIYPVLRILNLAICSFVPCNTDPTDHTPCRLFTYPVYWSYTLQVARISTWGKAKLFSWVTIHWELFMCIDFPLSNY